MISDSSVTAARSVVTRKWEENISAVPSELLPGCRYAGSVVRYPDTSLDRAKGLACPPRINYWVRKTSSLSVRELYYQYIKPFP